MASTEREDGVSLYWETSGEGPLVVLVPYVNAFPDVWAGITEELAHDHRVLRYDGRGTGQSTRRGPYDAETAAGDLAAVIGDAGGPAVVIAIADAIMPAVRVGAERSDLVTAVVGIATAPVRIEAFSGTDAMAASSAVTGALLEQLGTDYRGALRTLLSAANPQMGEDEVRERVGRQIEHSPQEAAVGRLRAWTEVDAELEGLGVEMGERLWICTTDNVAGPWFPDADEMAPIIGERLPQAHVERIADGIVSRPDETAKLVREIVALRAEPVRRPP
jgi:pimeloyl-ACP methyl ester carboxylesterase